jgi:phage terminase large subunit-like protein
MVAAVLRVADPALPVTLVHAADGKAARAEPVAVLFEAGRAKFAGAFPELEDELAGFTPAGWGEPRPWGCDGLGDDRARGEAATGRAANTEAVAGSAG